MHPPPRLGPRPLPLHLGTALMTWASSESAWQLWKRDSPSSKPGTTAPEGVVEILMGVVALGGEGRFEHALQRDSCRRMDGLGRGWIAYRDHPFEHALETP